jgi:hypothetical protein
VVFLLYRRKRLGRLELDELRAQPGERRLQFAQR